VSTPAPSGFPAIRLAAFVGIAGLACTYWLALLDDPPVGRAFLALAMVAGAAALLALIERAAMHELRRTALAAAVVAGTTVAALVAVGVPLSTLFPGGWDRLGAGIDEGLTGFAGEVEFPYAGGEPWSRLILLGGLVCLLALAAALAFWPRRGARSGARIGGLATLIAIYAAAAAMRAGSEPLLLGLVLLLLAAAWLWLPGLDGRAAVITAGAVAALGVLALPVAAALKGDPWVAYRGWELAARSDPRSFTWDHSYGPLTPRTGTPLLSVRSAGRHYWRAAVLDDFDGYVWRRSRTDVGQPALELPRVVDRRSSAEASQPLNPDWVVRTEFTLRELQSEFAIAPGALISADGVEPDPTPNGTVLAGETLEEGDSYTALSYAPSPSADEMRAAPDTYAPALSRHTMIELPLIDSGSTEAGAQNEERVVVPLGGGRSDRGERVARTLTGSVYGGVFALAQRLVAGSDTTYDAVKAIEIYLSSRYDYVEDVPTDPRPLHAFLFEQRAGYCEQFSGSMALMLRMLGIPARVATGFSPGSPDGPDRYLVSDFEAHSWVEVYFTGIGWVPFDPTPGSAPAELQVSASGAASAAGGSTAGESRSRPEDPRERAPAAAPRSTGGVPLWPFAIALALPVTAGIALTAARIVRFRSLPTLAAAQAGTRELAAALERLRWQLRPSTTLSEVEDWFHAARRPAAAAYAAKLRAVRFGTGGQLPSRVERRRLRRELRRFPGWQSILGSYLAVPPGAPRRATRPGR
jgi:hypothetical protein